MGYLEILGGVAAVLALLYYYFTWTYDFWKVRGVAGPRPFPPFGNVAQIMFAKKEQGYYLKEVYDEYKGVPLYGIFARRTPVCVVCDLDLVKDVLIKDFPKFADRGLTVHEKAEPLGQHLFNLPPDIWKAIRAKLTPVFTSGKLKGMFNLILQCAKELENYASAAADKGEPIECHDMAARYTTDVISTCAFGVEVKALADEDCQFRKFGRKVFLPDTWTLVRFRLREALPSLFGFIGTVTPATSITKFFSKAIVDVIQERKMLKKARHDFIDILIELEKHQDDIPMKLTDYVLASQAFVFFAAGFETSSTTMTHALYELALNQDIQDQLRKEIIRFYTKCKGELTYEIVQEMPYLHKVFRETLRKYPLVTFLLRKSMVPYTFAGTDISIPKGTNIWIPVRAIHHDPDLYPNPDVFDPERFDPEIHAARHPMAFIPFGDGPRNCIGSRFAHFQTKIGLITIIKDYKVDVCEKTLMPYEPDPRAFILCPKGGIYLKLIRLNKN